MEPPLRKIIHVDMDAFFASVELLDHPHLRGQPVVVGGSPQSRAVVSAASYEARKFGIRSAMSCAEAKRRCPRAIFLSPHFERYKEISQKVHEIFRRYSSLIEPLSLDEAWLDVTHNLMGIPSATWVAQEICRCIYLETGLTASAGVSYNKFLAKIASDENKPNGLCVVPPEQAEAFLNPLPVGKIPGVGKVMQQRLAKEGISLVADLLPLPLEILQSKFGKMGAQLYLCARGIDEREIKTHRTRKSIGLERTFHQDLPPGPELTAILQDLLEGLYKRLEKYDKQGRNLTLKVKFEDFTQVTRSFSKDADPLCREEMAYHALEKLQQVCEQEARGRKIRLLGLSLGQLFQPIQTDEEQLDFFHLLSA